MTDNREFEFTLVLDGINDETFENASRQLFDAGCDDATFSMRCGYCYLTFARVATSFAESVLSAISDVRKSNCGASVVRIDECDLVTLTEIAQRIGRSKQLVHQYTTGKCGPGSFPPPVCHISDRQPLYYWCDVAEWLFENDMIDEQTFEQAIETSVINNVLELQLARTSFPELASEILSALGYE